MNISRPNGLVNRPIPGYDCCHWALVREGAAGDAEVRSLSKQAYLKRESKRMESAATAA